MSKRWWWFVLVVSVLLLVVSCGQQAAEVLPTLMPTAVPPIHSNQVAHVQFTPIPTLDKAFTPIPTLDRERAGRLGPTPTPTFTPPATFTPTPAVTPTPTSVPQVQPTGVALGWEDNMVDALGTPLPTPIPTAVPTFDVGDHITNFLILGSDTDDDSNGVARTDSLIIVSVNRETKTASMVSLPRDLYVYIPDWTMNRINTAYSTGVDANYPGGGIARLKDAIQYNLGIPIHYYARLDFTGFKQIIDLLDGVEISVSCRLTDWRLKSPDLDITLEESYERFTLEPGIYDMDGDLALWYARSRMTTSDFDRGRRQQQILRAILEKGVEADLLDQIPTLWVTYRDIVDTDMDIGRALQLAPMAYEVEENGLQHIYLVGDNLIPWTVPTTGASVQLPNWEKMEETLGYMFEPPALSSVYRSPITVEIVNGTGNEDMGALAAENLAWQGFIPEVTETLAEPVDYTTITYYGPNWKGSFNWMIAWVFDQYRGQLILESEERYEYNYRVVLGEDFDPCRPQLFAPLPNSE
ncbi:MAG TPA: LCP family protein [Anaerolineae bacterium]|nr:LCP family protein [Anaerolineae bacterium]